ncbi:MAG TPA: CBS domain-containing protein [Actinomycetota bacterium]|jgi:CBS domain-containing protein
MENRVSIERLLGSVEDAMTAPVVTITERTIASEAARILERSGASGAPVTAEVGGQVVGVVTLKDLMAKAGVPDALTKGPFHRFEHLLAGIEVDRVMSRDVVTAQADWPLTRAVEIMRRKGINRLPVVDGSGRLVGILTRDDVLRAVALRSDTTAGAGSLIEPD